MLVEEMLNSRNSDLFYLWPFYVDFIKIYWC
jgi:hypothetical protein